MKSEEWKYDKIYMIQRICNRRCSFSKNIRPSKARVETLLYPQLKIFLEPNLKKTTHLFTKLHLHGLQSSSSEVILYYKIITSKVLPFFVPESLLEKKLETIQSKSIMQSLILLLLCRINHSLEKKYALLVANCRLQLPLQ